MRKIKQDYKWKDLMFCKIKGHIWVGKILTRSWVLLECERCKKAKIIKLDDFILFLTREIKKGLKI